MATVRILLVCLELQIVIFEVKNIVIVTVAVRFFVMTWLVV